MKCFFLTAVLFFNKYINHYNYNVLIIFIRLSFVTFPQPLWLRSSKNFIFTLRFIIFFTNKLWWYLQIKQTHWICEFIFTSFELIICLPTLNFNFTFFGVIVVIDIFCTITAVGIIAFFYTLPDGSGDLLISVGNNITYLSILSGSALLMDWGFINERRK